MKFLTPPHQCAKGIRYNSPAKNVRERYEVEDIISPGTTDRTKAVRKGKLRSNTFTLPWGKLRQEEKSVNDSNLSLLALRPCQHLEPYAPKNTQNVPVQRTSWKNATRIRFWTSERRGRWRG